MLEMNCWNTYEKNCWNVGFINIAEQAEHVIVLQMHPSSAQEHAMLFDEVHALDPHAIVHTVLARRVRHQACMHTLLNGIKGQSCMIVCKTNNALVSLLQLFYRTESKIPMPCTVTGVKYENEMLNLVSVAVLAQESLHWDDILNMAQDPPRNTVCSIHTHTDQCLCTCKERMQVM
jgi:hypothetical protein